MICYTRITVSSSPSRLLVPSHHYASARLKSQACVSYPWPSLESVGHSFDEHPGPDYCQDVSRDLPSQTPVGEERRSHESTSILVADLCTMQHQATCWQDGADI